MTEITTINGVTQIENTLPIAKEIAHVIEVFPKEEMREMLKAHGFAHRLEESSNGDVISIAGATLPARTTVENILQKEKELHKSHKAFLSAVYTEYKKLAYSEENKPDPNGNDKIINVKDLTPLKAIVVGLMCIADGILDYEDSLCKK